MLSQQLLLDRAGNFTASENHRLMAGWDEPKPSSDFEGFSEMYRVIKPLYEDGERKFLVGDLSGLVNGFKVTGELIKKTVAVVKSEKVPQGLITYAEEKAMETLFEPDPSLQFSTAHTRNGEEREVDCMMMLSMVTGLNFQFIGDEQKHIHADEVGCTPDGVIIDDLDLVETGAEAKCKSPLVHAKNLLIENNKDLQEEAFDHFVQVQTAMLVTGANHWYFANYNPFAKLESMKFKHIVIERDNDFIEVLNERLTIAKRIKSEFLNNFSGFQIEIKEAA